MQKLPLFGVMCTYLFVLTVTPANGAALNFTTLPYLWVEDISDDGTIVSRGNGLVVLADDGTVTSA